MKKYQSKGDEFWIRGARSLVVTSSHWQWLVTSVATGVSLSYRSRPDNSARFSASTCMVWGFSGSPLDLRAREPWMVEVCRVELMQKLLFYLTMAQFGGTLKNLRNSEDEFPSSSAMRTNRAKHTRRPELASSRDSSCRSPVFIGRVCSLWLISEETSAARRCSCKQANTSVGAHKRCFDPWESRNCSPRVEIVWFSCFFTRLIYQPGCLLKNRYPRALRARELHLVCGTDFIIIQIHQLSNRYSHRKSVLSADAVA